MIQALVICQLHGLNHRMVKPSNIFFNRVKGEIKLGDYGEARILHDSMSSTFSGEKKHNQTKQQNNKKKRQKKTKKTTQRVL